MFVVFDRFGVFLAQSVTSGCCILKPGRDERYIFNASRTIIQVWCFDLTGGGFGHLWGRPAFSEFIFEIMSVVDVILELNIMSSVRTRGHVDGRCSASNDALEITSSPVVSADLFTSAQVFL